MRLATVLLFLLGLGALAVAAYAGGPIWRVGLYVSGFFFTLFAQVALAALIETAAPERARTGWSLLALIAEAGAMVQSRRAPLGSIPERALLELHQTGFSVLGLGLCVGGVVLALLGLRSKSRVAGALAGLALLEALFALGPWLARLS